MGRVRCAIVGSGNIGTDLLYKLRRSETLEPVAMIGIDPTSEGLQRAREVGVTVSSDGVPWLFDQAADLGVELVFEATSASVHRENAPGYRDAGLVAVDLTPAKVGPLVVPPVNLDAHPDAYNVNLITCGGQATVPLVHAVARVCRVPYAEIISSVASVSAGLGTRQNIDEFTLTTSGALVEVGGAKTGKAIMVLNPADPPILMRNTVYCALDEEHDPDAVAASLHAMVDEVSTYVPGYRLVADPVFELGEYQTPGGQASSRVVALLEVEGAGDFFPPYAGNLDIMTASAVRVGESMVAEAVTA